jgi:hypothetical protein
MGEKHGSQEKKSYKLGKIILKDMDLTNTVVPLSSRRMFRDPQ